MKKNTLSFAENITVGLMLFALFLGAGNIIFPPLLGQQAGENLVIAIIGFLITGVGLPFLAIVAIAKSGGDLQHIASRVHPVFGIIFTTIVYLAIGPLFGIPRTATVAYEIGVSPFLDTSIQKSEWPLIFTSIIFFIVTILFALNPSKMVDRIGKILTPVLLLVISLLAIKSFITPLGDLGQPNEVFKSQAFAESFIQGYLTMDVLGALVFGIVIIHSLHDKGLRDTKEIVKSTIFAGVIAAVGLAFVYISLSYIGATSIDTIGVQDNGGSIIAKSAFALYGSFGSVILSVAIILACLTTSIGLVSASAQFFESLFPKVSYKVFVFIFAGFSTVLANFGLSQLISFSLPVLLSIYPIAIVLMLLSLIDHLFSHKTIVYTTALLFTAVVSFYDGLKEANIILPKYEELLSYLPLYEQSIGWLLPAIVGTVIGCIISLFMKK